MKKIASILFMLVLSFIFLWWIKPQTSTIYIYDVFDTYSEITINSGDEKILSECSDYLHYLDRIWSTTREDSEINNLQKGLSPQTRDIIEKSIDYSKKTKGDFDITVGKSSKLWNDAINSKTLPTDEEIQTARETIGYTALSEGNLSNASLTLGAIAKGYASDRILEILKNSGIDSAMINLGGNIYALGTQGMGKPWNIGIQDPQNPDKTIGRLKIRDSAVVTSGNYIRYFDFNGTRYHHIINPHTGMPANSGLISVTIISPDATTADALSTASFTGGLEEGISLISEFGVMGIFITDDNNIYYSHELAFTPDNDDYTYNILK